MLGIGCGERQCLVFELCDQLGHLFLLLCTLILILFVFAHLLCQFLLLLLVLFQFPLGLFHLCFVVSHLSC